MKFKQPLEDENLDEEFEVEPVELVEDIGEDVDFDTCETLIDDGILSSLDIIQLIGALNDEFDISIPATEIIPENFNSVDAMAAMVARLSEE